MSLADHLNTMGLRRELAELLAKTDGLIRILAHSDTRDVRAQADLDGLIHLHRLFEHYLKAAIELRDMGNVQGSRRSSLEADVQEWGDSLERWKQEYRAVAERLERWEDAKNATNVQTEVRTPMTWTGKKRALGLEGIGMWKRGELKTATWEDAVHIHCARYVDENGRPFNAKNIIDSLNVRKKKEGKPFLN
jgi:hypothetical protein